MAVVFNKDLLTVYGFLVGSTVAVVVVVVMYLAIDKVVAGSIFGGMRTVNYNIVGIAVVLPSREVTVIFSTSTEAT